MNNKLSFLLHCFLNCSNSRVLNQFNSNPPWWKVNMKYFTPQHRQLNNLYFIWGLKTSRSQPLSALQSESCKCKTTCSLVPGCARSFQRAPLPQEDSISPGKKTHWYTITSDLYSFFHPSTMHLLP